MTMLLKALLACLSPDVHRMKQFHCIDITKEELKIIFTQPIPKKLGRLRQDRSVIMAINLKESLVIVIHHLLNTLFLSTATGNQIKLITFIPLTLLK